MATAMAMLSGSGDSRKHKRMRWADLLIVAWFAFVGVTCCMDLIHVVNAADEGVLSFTSSTLSIAENAGSVLVTVTRNCADKMDGFCNQEVSVAYSTESPMTTSAWRFHFLSYATPCFLSCSLCQLYSIIEVDRNHLKTLHSYMFLISMCSFQPSYQ